MTKSETAPVLVVDDEWIIRNQLTRALDSVGVGCDHAVSGDDALSKFRDCDHQLVVTDLRMPHCNGHSLAVSLLADPHPPAVVVLTGVTEPKIARDLLARGVSEVVFKPVNYFELANRLKYMLAPTESSSEAGQTVVANDSAAAPEQTSDSSSELLAWTREKLETQLIQSPPINLWLTMALRSLIGTKSLIRPPRRTNSWRSRHVMRLQKSVAAKIGPRGPNVRLRSRWMTNSNLLASLSSC